MLLEVETDTGTHDQMQGKKKVTIPDTVEMDLSPGAIRALRVKSLMSQTGWKEE